MRQGNSRAALGVRLNTTLHHPRRRAVRGLAALTMSAGLVAAAVAATPPGADAAASHRGMFRQVDLVSDIPGMAAITDPAVKNPWGIAFGPKKTPTPLWVSNQFSDDADLLTQITLYTGANGVIPIAKVPLEVTGSSPTGIVFNGTTDFVINQAGVDTPARFLFSEAFADAAGDPEARITGWSNVPAPAPSTTPTDASVDPAFPTGLALVPRHNGVAAHLLMVDGFSGDPVVHVYNTHFADVTKPGRFTDPHIAAEGMIPYNVTFLKGKVYVTYFNGPAQGGGAISTFTRRGTFIKRLTTGLPLNAPWGLAVAPKGWNGFGRALIVGNVDDGTIHAFGIHDGHLRGTLNDLNGKPLVNPGLWGLTFGNGNTGTPRSLLFSAGISSTPGEFGPDTYEHGLVGLIEPPGRHDEVD